MEVGTGDTMGSTVLAVMELGELLELSRWTVSAMEHDQNEGPAHA